MRARVFGDRHLASCFYRLSISCNHNAPTGTIPVGTVITRLRVAFSSSLERVDLASAYRLLLTSENHHTVSIQVTLFLDHMQQINRRLRTLCTVYLVFSLTWHPIKVMWFAVGCNRLLERRLCFLQSSQDLWVEPRVQIVSSLQFFARD